MNFDDADSQPLKDWMVKKLGTISDADPDVLADYVLALVKSDEPEAEVRRSCQESLEDFLEDNTKTFISDVFLAIKSKTYLPPNSRPPKPANGDTPSNGKATSSSVRGAPTSSLGKRSRVDGQDEVEADTSRNSKMMRGGRGRGRGGGIGRRTLQAGAAAFELLPQSYPPIMPQIDWNDPAQFSMAWQAMQAMMGFQMPMMTTNGLGHNPSAEPCRDFYEQGMCPAGETCPYDHGTAAVMPGRNGSTTSLQSYKNTAASSARTGRGGARGDRGGRGQRSYFSQKGTNGDKQNTSIVVEQIPQEHLSEDAVREFFSTFGTIRKVAMHPETRLAIVEYEDWASGKAAYDSPKVIFDNRFVKVYWHRPEVLKGKLEHETRGEAEQFDLEEFTRRQAEAQRKHEEHMRKVEEARVAREALEAKIQAHAEALNTLKEKLPTEQSSSTVGKEEDIEIRGESTDPQTAALQAQLKQLEAEAQTLGIANTDEDESGFSRSTSYYNQSSWLPRGRGRGRGRGYAPRGAYRGRGSRAGFAGYAAGSVARLDNRPRNVELQTVDTSIDIHDEEHSEALRTMLFNIGDFLFILPHPDAPQQKNRAVVGFRERYVAESFIGAVEATSHEIPGVGKCELAWVGNDKMKPPDVAAVATSLTKHDADVEDEGEMEDTLAQNGGSGDEEDENIEDAAANQDVEERDENPDHDVADDDDDRWMR